MDKFLYFCYLPPKKRCFCYVCYSLSHGVWNIVSCYSSSDYVHPISYHIFFFVNIGDINQVSAGNELGPPLHGWQRLTRSVHKYNPLPPIVIHTHSGRRDKHIRECNINLRKETHDRVNTWRKRKIVKTKPCTMTKTCPL